jgi:hypothetical protein
MNEKRGFNNLSRYVRFILIITFLSFAALAFAQKSSAPYPPSEMVKSIHQVTGLLVIEKDFFILVGLCK